MAENGEGVELESPTSTDPQLGADAGKSPTPDESSGASPGTEAEPSKDDGGQAATQKATTEPQEPSLLEQAIDRLAGPKGTEETKPKDGKEEAKDDGKGEKPDGKEKPTEEKPKQEDKKADPLEGFTDEERRALPKKTRRRIEQIFSEQTRLSEELDKAKDDITWGKDFRDGVVAKFNLQNDVPFVMPDQLAGAILFQAALNRQKAGNPLPQDIDIIRDTSAAIAATAQSLGLVKAEEKAPDLDLDVIEKALKSARFDAEYGEVDTKAALDAIAKARGTQKPAEKPAKQPQTTQPGQPAQPVQQQPPQMREDPDDALYEGLAAQAILESGIKKEGLSEYYQKKVLPAALQQIAKLYPGSAPDQVFKVLSPKAKHDIVLQAHGRLLKEAQALKPKPKTPAPATRPIATAGGKPVWAQDQVMAPSSKAAVDFLSGD